MCRFAGMIVSWILYVILQIYDKIESESSHDFYIDISSRINTESETHFSHTVSNKL